MKRLFGLLIAAAFIASASLALAKDYQVTGPVVDVKDDHIIVKKGNENWEIARDKDTKAGEIKKGDRVTIKYKMIATSVESKTKAKAEEKPKGDAKAGAMKDEKKADAKAGAMKDEKKADAKTK